MRPAGAQAEVEGDRPPLGEVEFLADTVDYDAVGTRSCGVL